MPNFTCKVPKVALERFLQDFLISPEELLSELRQWLARPQQFFSSSTALQNDGILWISMQKHSQVATLLFVFADNTILIDQYKKRVAELGANDLK